jgi:hypothetical protein
MSFIGGDFKMVGPATAVQTTPAQDAAAAAKLERARAGRAKRKADQAAGVTTEPVAESQSQSPERERLPWHVEGERVDVDQSPDEPRTPDESRWPVDPETGARMSPKLYARRQADRQATEATERGDAQPSGKVAYLNTVASDDEYQAAKSAYEQADASLRALLTEQAAFTGKMQDAIAVRDLDAIGKLRARQRKLPDLIFAARMGATQLKLSYFQMRAARARVAKQEARAAASKVSADFQEWQRRVNIAQSAAQTAAYESDDAVRDVGAVQRELDQLDQEALAMAVRPQMHRAPVGMQQDGADTSYMQPMPRPGLPIEQA